MTYDEIIALYPVGTIFDSLGGNKNVKVKSNDYFTDDDNYIRLYSSTGKDLGRITECHLFNRGDYYGRLAKIVSKPLPTVINNYEIY